MAVAFTAALLSISVVAGDTPLGRGGGDGAGRGRSGPAGLKTPAGRCRWFGAKRGDLLIQAAIFGPVFPGDAVGPIRN
jgi:hypothetical protein